MKRTWKQFRHRLEYLGMRLLAGCVPLLPRRACVGLAHILAGIYYRCDSRSRGIALENLRVCFGETLDAKRRERIARDSYRNFGRAMLDLFWSRRLTRENYTRYLKFEGMPAAMARKEEHGSIVFILMHQGSYEALSVGGAYSALPIWTVAMDFKNPALEAIFGEARSHTGHRIANRRQSMLRLLRAVRRREGVALLIDLALGLEHPGEVIDTFGLKMHVTSLHAVLYERTGVPLIPLTNIPHPDGTCTVTVHPPLTFPAGASRQEIVQGCWDFFEPFIRARPDLWLWSYRHWRHKPVQAGAQDYPAYARSSAQFERVLAGERTGPPAKPTVALVPDPLPAADRV